MKNSLHSFLEKGTRNKLIITQSLENLGLKATDVGIVLGRALQGKEDSWHLSTIAEEALKKILDQQVHYREDIGSFLALTNLGILFEPELKIDIAGIFKGFSQNNVLFIEWPGQKEGDTLYFLSKEKGKQISLKGVSHLMI